MKTGKNIDIVTLLENLQQNKAKQKDYIVQANAIKSELGFFNFSFKYKQYETKVSGKLTETAERQIAEKLDINYNYFKKISKEKTNSIKVNYELTARYDETGSKVFGSTKDIDVYDDTINYWLRNKEYKNKRFFIRTFEPDDDIDISVIRAILSDRYKPIDNFDLILAVINALKETDIKLNVESADLTKDKMFIRFIAPGIEQQYKELLKYKPAFSPGSINTGVLAGFIISNSETGLGSYKFNPRIYIKSCKNGLIRADETLNTVHLGSKREKTGAITFSETTRQKELELIQSELKDIVKYVCSVEYIGKVIDDIERIGSYVLQYPVQVIEQTSKDLLLNKEDIQNLVNIFFSSGLKTAFGLTQSVTEYAQRKEPETKFRLEKAGFDVMEKARYYDRKSFNVPVDVQSN